jgi:hypothetical protein
MRSGSARCASPEEHAMSSRTAVLLALCSLCACANHIRYSDQESDQERRSVLSARHTVSGPDSVLDQTQLRLAFFKQETVESRTERTIARYEEATPYRGAREVLEVPAGLVSVPLSFVFNGVDCLLLGYVPNELVNGYTSWTFAALNPFMNTESPERTERTQVSVETRDVGRSESAQHSAADGAAVGLALDGRPEQVRTLDAEGAIAMSLLDLMTGDDAGAPRRLNVVLRDAAGAELLRQSFYLDRSLAVRMQRAALLAREVASPAIEPDALARAIYAIDRLGFREDAARIHESAHERFAAEPDRIEAIGQSIDRLYAENPALESVLGTVVPGLPASAEPAPLD